MQAEKVTYHETAESLDSSDAFEGPEKTLRVYFKAAAKQSNGLLQISRDVWEKALDLVKCKVLSVLIHPHVHAYVLSESSFFVYPEHVILKTCGTTTLLEGLPAILDIVEQHHDRIGISPKVIGAFYSRRSYFNPEKQPHPHGCWDDEVSRLKKFFPMPTFASQFGVNRDERWHLFTHACPSVSTPRLHDGWIELMMTGIDHELATKFHLVNHEVTESVPGESKSLEDSVVSLDSIASMVSAVGADPDDDDPGHLMGNVMTRVAKVDDLFATDKQCIDSFAFSPCGYSCNGVLLEEGKYFTIHVTPERGFSYASFETNVENLGKIEQGLTHQKLVERVLDIFSPAKLTVAVCMPSNKRLVDPSVLKMGEYQCVSEAEFDIGNASVVHYNLRKL